MDLTPLEPGLTPVESVRLPPISTDAFKRLVTLPGKAWAVYCILLARRGAKRTRRITLWTSDLQDYGLRREDKYRALRHLEAAGLITVERANGQNPVVTLLSV